jgi:DNA-directed RNA polymerase alpha subunit
MKKKCELELYFEAHLSLTEYPSLLVRAANALSRKGIKTMDALCAMTDEELKKTRNLGEKSLAAAIIMRETYQNYKKRRLIN